MELSVGWASNAKTVVPLIVLLLSIANQSYSQDVLKALKGGLGESKKDVKSKLESAKANISEGITEQGYTFIMDEDPSNSISWIFNDDLICVGQLFAFGSAEGKKIVMAIRDETSKYAEKVKPNQYRFENIIIVFGTRPDGTLTLLVQSQD